MSTACPTVVFARHSHKGKPITIDNKVRARSASTCCDSKQGTDQCTNAEPPGYDYAGQLANDPCVSVDVRQGSKPELEGHSK